MGGACSANAGGRKCTQNFDFKARREETIRNIEEYMVGQYYNGSYGNRVRGCGLDLFDAG
jgi:hypothetical protein